MWLLRRELITYGQNGDTLSIGLLWDFAQTSGRIDTWWDTLWPMPFLLRCITFV